MEEGLIALLYPFTVERNKTGFWSSDFREAGTVDEVKVSVKGTDVRYRQKLTNSSQYVYVFP